MRVERFPRTSVSLSAPSSRARTRARSRARGGRKQAPEILPRTYPFSNAAASTNESAFTSLTYGHRLGRVLPKSGQSVGRHGTPVQRAVVHARRDHSVKVPRKPFIASPAWRFHLSP